MTGCTILDWRPMRRNSLLGFVKVQLPSGLIVCDVTILRGPNGLWAAPPSKPLINRDGIALKDAAGKIRYASVISFVSKETKDRWSAAVLAALQSAFPEALE
jgi:DNA-binding cell septation regulator SpoVG